jgi:hypothetical protein
MEGPFLGGWEIYHLKASPAEPNRLYCSQSNGWFGQIIQRSDDGRCLEIAGAVRTVLIAFAELLAAALADNKTRRDAVGMLSKKRSQKSIVEPAQEPSDAPPYPTTVALTTSLQRRGGQNRRRLDVAHRDPKLRLQRVGHRRVRLNLPDHDSHARNARLAGRILVLDGLLERLPLRDDIRDRRVEGRLGGGDGGHVACDEAEGGQVRVRDGDEIGEPGLVVQVRRGDKIVRHFASIASNLGKNEPNIAAIVVIHGHLALTLHKKDDENGRKDFPYGEEDVLFGR